MNSKTSFAPDLEKAPTATSSNVADVTEGEAKHVDPFASEEGAEVQYKTMEWWHVGLLMIAETISLGILSLPAALATIGLVPGLILILGLGVLATYTGYVIGQFKLAYPHVCSMADAGEVILGPIGREILGFAQVTVLVFIMAAHVTSFSIMMNVLTNHATCSIVFGLLGFIVCLIMALPRTLKCVSYISVVSCLSVVTAVLITMTCVGILKPNPGQIEAVQRSSLSHAMIAALNIIISYAGHVAFFGFAAELRDPRDFPKALILVQSVSTSFYIVVAVVIYYYAGNNVPAPALSAASPLVRKIAYGIATPTIVIAGVVNGHVACKYVYLRIWKGTNVIHQKGSKSFGSWAAICTTLWFLAWLIAEAVPSFSQLLGLVSALFCGWFSYGLTGVFWLWINKGKYWSCPRKVSLTVLNVTILCLGGVICSLGLYASGKAIHDGEGGSAFSCADNSLASSH